MLPHRQRQQRTGAGQTIRRRESRLRLENRQRHPDDRRSAEVTGKEGEKQPIWAWIITVTVAAGVAVAVIAVSRSAGRADRHAEQLGFLRRISRQPKS